MDGEKLQAKVYQGYGKAASRIGQPTDVYRPLFADDPLGNCISNNNRLAAFTQNFNFNKPNEYGSPTWKVITDGTELIVGDYLVTPDSTYFIAAMQHLLPILAVSCNRTIQVVRVGQPDQEGAVGYGGITAENKTPIMVGWPASILQGTKWEKNIAGLPGDERLSWWSILLPEFAGVVIMTADLIIDDLGRQYVVSSPELTDLGWRLTASLQGA